MCPTNYKDFYQKALVPIGSNDKNCLKNLISADLPDHSHWLIALEGETKDQEAVFYIWKVTIYPSDSTGSFSWNSPYYSSPIYDSIHMAYNHANDLEKCSKNDQLYFSKLNERI
ncbi:hypothetical protein [Bacillus sp. S/N-304-OC-R1]|uniref:hypothetical protein n=1 Tax=Bacillus sp. S/N-304-OC-R1 TaxID=2758034 RepID=UPI001C8D4582|nr:hypothetical protein [Bacillus sp. S/N-304-OC-R1]MBY0120914.1 hypothetical protein [Bacillus sp. S/N-304-OC-R1]